MRRLADLRTWSEVHAASLRHAGAILAVAIPVLFLVAALVRAAPFVDDLPLPSSEGDDWVTYKISALSIVHGGLTMPSMGIYAGTVHGFVYNYFVAAIFAVVGENTAWVYVAQGVLLGASASVIYLTWRDALSPLGGLVLLAGTAAIVYVDVFRNIGFRLLSENLFLFLLAASLYLIVEAHRRPSWRAAALGGLALGTAVLSRTNLLVASVAILAVALVNSALRRTPAAVAAAAVAGYLVGMSALPVRELAATGIPDLQLLVPTKDDLNLPDTSSLAAFADHYVRQVLFTLGFATAIEPAYRIRPHWPFLWLGAFAYAWWRIRGSWSTRRIRLDLREGLVLLVLVLYLGPVLALSYPSNYGGRMLTVVLPLVLALGIIFVDERFLRAEEPTA